MIIMKKNNDKQFNAYQRGSIVTINRSDIIDDDCNPRIIDQENRKNLKKSIKKYGLVGHIVWNENTKHVVGGHQRIDVIDEMMKNKEYNLDVLKVNLSEKEEIELNVVLNNAEAQGKFDFGQLSFLADKFNIDVSKDFMFSEDIVLINFPNFADKVTKNLGFEQKELSEEQIQKIKDRKKAFREEIKKNREEHGDYKSETRGILTIVFDNEKQKKEFLLLNEIEDDTEMVSIHEINHILEK
jgi:hypothetical protein